MDAPQSRSRFLMLLFVVVALPQVLVEPVVVIASMRTVALISVVVGLALVFVVSDDRPFVDSTDVVGCRSRLKYRIGRHSSTNLVLPDCSPILVLATVSCVVCITCSRVVFSIL